MRAIKKAEGDDKTNYESIVYEGYGHSGIAVIVECLSDNNTCNLNTSCKLKPVINNALNLFIAEFYKYTLYDIL